MLEHNEILARVDNYYTDKVKAHGPIHSGVDWNSAESQHLRFEQLLKLVDNTQPFSLNDYGCGYGALARYMIERGYEVTYRGFDISQEMINQASTLLVDASNCSFFRNPSELSLADY